MANVDPDALLGRETLLVRRNGDPDDEDRTHKMGRVIQGAASIRFDPDAPYSACSTVRMKWGCGITGEVGFDREFFYAHRYLARQVMVIE